MYYKINNAFNNYLLDGKSEFISYINRVYITFEISYKKMKKNAFFSLYVVVSVSASYEFI